MDTTGQLSNPPNLWPASSPFSHDQRRGPRTAQPSQKEAGTSKVGEDSARRKEQVVLRLLRGESLDLLAQETGQPAGRIAGWREEFLAAGREGLKSRPAPDGDRHLHQPQANPAANEGGRAARADRAGAQAGGTAARGHDHRRRRVRARVSRGKRRSRRGFCGWPPRLKCARARPPQGRTSPRSAPRSAAPRSYASRWRLFSPPRSESSFTSPTSRRDR